MLDLAWGSFTIFELLAQCMKKYRCLRKFAKRTHVILSINYHLKAMHGFLANLVFFRQWESLLACS